MNNDNKLYLFVTLASIGVLTTGLVVSNASGVESFTHLFRNSNPIVFNKSNNSVGNVDPITGLSSVSFEPSNRYVLISTGHNSDESFYERHMGNIRIKEI